MMRLQLPRCNPQIDIATRLQLQAGFSLECAQSGLFASRWHTGRSAVSMVGLLVVTLILARPAAHQGRRRTLRIRGNF